MKTTTLLANLTCTATALLGAATIAPATVAVALVAVVVLGCCFAVGWLAGCVLCAAAERLSR